jgi:tetratricopeptide (TPR) repeat protein
MILMSALSQINGRVRRMYEWWLAAAVLAAISLSCSPASTRMGGESLNPVEILEHSPRIYHISFEGFADSLETERAETYLGGVLDPNALITPPDTARLEEISDRDLARLEYYKAVRRFRGGAGRAALMHIRKSLELDPGHGPSYTFLGRLLMAQGRTKEAMDLFRQVLAWDPANTEALVGLARGYMFVGEPDSARQALVDAVIYNRTDLEAWRNLHILGDLERFTVADHDISVLGYVREKRGRHYELVIDDSLEDCPSLATAWIVFASQRAVWQYEGKFKRVLGSTRYRRTYEEDIDCFMALAAAWKILAEGDSTVCEGDYLQHVSRVAEDGYLVPHVLFDYVCLEQPLAARNFRTDVIDKMRAYINDYVLVAGG